MATRLSRLFATLNALRAAVRPTLMKLSGIIRASVRSRVKEGLSARTRLVGICGEHTRRLCAPSTNLIVATNEPAINRLVRASASRPVVLLSFERSWNVAEAGIQLARGFLSYQTGAPRYLASVTRRLTAARLNPERSKDNACPGSE